MSKYEILDGVRSQPMKLDSQRRIYLPKWVERELAGDSRYVVFVKKGNDIVIKTIRIEVD